MAFTQIVVLRTGSPDSMDLSVLDPSSLSLDTFKYLLVWVDCLSFGSLVRNIHQFLNSGTNCFLETAWSRLLRTCFFISLHAVWNVSGVEWVILVMYSYSETLSQFLNQMLGVVSVRFIRHRLTDCRTVLKMGRAGEFLALTGYRLDGAEMHSCGLATHYVPLEVQFYFHLKE